MNRSPRRLAPGQLRQRQRNEVRQALLDGGAALLARGRRDFSVQDLAEEVGCSTGAIYRYFSSKAAIVDAVRAHQLQGLLARLARRDAELDDDLRSAGIGEAVVAAARLVGQLRQLHEACLADPLPLSAALDALVAPGAGGEGEPVATEGEALRLVQQVGDALAHATARDRAPSGLAAAMVVSVTTVSLAAIAGRLPVAQASWCARQWTEAVVRVAGADAAVVEEAADLAWPVDAF